ncbi:Transcriptional regulator, AlpA family, partial [Dysosmobacter welbionis]
PAGTGQDQPPDLPAVGAALKALEDGRVLRVHRHDLGAVRIRRIHHQLSGADQRLLVGQGDALSLPDGG